MKTVEKPISLGFEIMLLFVYGTLRRGQRNHHFLENARFITKAKSTAVFSVSLKKTDKYPEGYPIALPSDAANAQKLEGEIYEIDEETLMRIDILEEYPHEYDRIELPFECDNGEMRNALIYIGKESEDDL